MHRLSSLVAAATVVVGCGAPAEPKPARLDPAAATAITVGLVGGNPQFCPGGAAPQLDVAVTTSTGAVLDSWSQDEARAGKLPFNTFEWTTSWGSVDGDGFVRLPDDAIAAIERTVTSPRSRNREFPIATTLRIERLGAAHHPG